MAQITNATTTTSITEVVPAEEILQAVGDVNRAVPVAMSVAAVFAAPGVSPTINIPLWSDAAVPLSEASDNAETEDLDATEQLLTEASIAAATVAIRKALSDEASLHSQIDAIAGLIRENGLAMLEQFDEDVLTNITSATNTSNFSGLDFTIERWGTALAGLRANTGPGRVVGVFHDFQVDDLRASLRASGLGYGLFQQPQGASMLNQQAKGLMGELEGVLVYSTKEVPQFDANNWSGAFLRLGDHPGNSGLAAAVWRGITTELQREIVTISTDLVTHSIYGSTLVRNDCVEEVVTSKT